MIGKTPQEVAALASQAVGAAQQVLARNTPTYAQPIANPTQSPALAPDEYVTGATLQDQGQRVVQHAGQAAQNAAAPAVHMAAQMGLDLVKAKHPEVFQKYGPEIQNLLVTVPKENWSIDNLNLIVDVVRGRHVDELVDARASQRLAQDPALRSSGANGLQSTPSAPGPFAQLSAEHKALLARNNLTEKDIVEHAAKFGMPVEKWVEVFAKKSVGA